MDDTMIRFHREGLEANLAEYVRDGDPSDAYCVLENAGLLRRHDPSAGDDAGLFALSAFERRQLVEDACRYIADITIADCLRPLLDEAKDFSDEDLDFVESMVIRRDALGVAIVVAHHITAGEGVPACLLKAAKVRDEIDEVLCSRPDVLCVASRALTVYADSPPWLAKARGLDLLLEDCDL